MASLVRAGKGWKCEMLEGGNPAGSKVETLLEAKEEPECCLDLDLE